MTKSTGAKRSASSPYGSSKKLRPEQILPLDDDVADSAYDDDDTAHLMDF